MYDCIIFDIDGTILDTREVSLLAVQKAYFEESGNLLPLAELSFAFGITTQNTAKRLHVADAVAFTNRIDEHYHHLSYKNRIFPGMKKAISDLYAQNTVLGIVTSKTIWEYQHDFRLFELEKYFKTAICVEDTPRHKPEPEPLFEFFARSGQRAETSLYIGDSANDQLCARAAGVDFALAGWGAVESLSAKYVLSEPDEIFDIMK